MRFTKGDHLRVWRPVGPFGYYHHGIYVSDDRVIQFGGRIRDKPGATVGAVSLATFERGGCAKVVGHGGRTWWGSPRFDALPREEAVRTAEWLVANHPEGLYNLFGYNCEQAANFCSTGAYESYQVRGLFAVNLLTGIPVMLLLAKRSREGPPLSRAVRLGLHLFYLAQLVPNVLYYVNGARFMRKVGRRWSEYERAHHKTRDE